MIPQAKEQIVALCSDREIAPLLAKVAKSDKVKSVRVAGCKVFVGLDKMGIFDVKKANKDLVKAYADLKVEKWAAMNLKIANKEYAAESVKMARMAVSTRFGANHEKGRRIVFYGIEAADDYLAVIIDRLSDKWWRMAEDAKEWKAKYQCMETVSLILSGDDWTNASITADIYYDDAEQERGHRQRGPTRFCEIMASWMANEQHISTLISIFQVMLKLIESLPKKTVKHVAPTMVKCIMTKYWMYSRMDMAPALLVLVNSTLTVLCLKV